MRIDYLYIENFKCISKLEISDLKDLNVIAGINGSGKSSILLAIKILLSWFVSRLKNPKGNGLPIQENDIMNGKNFALLKIRLTDGTSWQIYTAKRTYREPNQEKSDYSQMNVLCNKIAGSLDSGDFDIMLIAPYDVNRIVGETPQRVRKTNKDTQLDMMEVSMTNSVNFHDFFIQFRELEDLENEKMRDNGFLQEDIRLKSIRRAIQSVFPDYGDLKCRRSKPRGFVIEKNGEKFDFKQLSDGEKSYICLIGDIARKLAVTHPSLENPLDGDGIVLIDEAELHLQPSWQRKLIDNLRRTFKNCQFLITTHSALVVSSINRNKGDKLVLLKDGNGFVKDNVNVYGKEVSKLLTEIFDMESLRDPDVQEKMDRVWEILNDGISESDELKENMAWLHEHIESSDMFFGLVNRQKFINNKQNEKNK